MKKKIKIMTLGFLLITLLISPVFADIENNITNNVVEEESNVEITDLKFESNREANSQTATTGDTIALSFSSDKQLEQGSGAIQSISFVDESVLSEYQIPEFVENIVGEKYTYSASIVISDEMFEEGKLICTNIKFNYGSETITIDFGEKNINYYKSLEVSEITFISSNSDTTKAVDNDILTVSFLTNMPITINSTSKLNDKIELTFSDDDQSGAPKGKYIYKATYTINKNDFETCDILCSAAQIEGKDIDSFQTNVAFENAISYTAEADVSAASFYSNSNYGDHIILSGDSAIVSFSMTEADAKLITIEGKAKIDGEEIDFSSSTSEGYTTFSASKVFSEFEDRKNINCDLSGIVIKQTGYSDKGLETPEDIIVLHHPLELKNKQFVSSNADQTIAYDKDVLTVTFETNYSVDIKNIVMINGKEISFSENKVSETSYIYTASLTIQKDDFTTGPLSCSSIQIRTNDFGDFLMNISFENTISYIAEISDIETLFYSNSSKGDHVIFSGDSAIVSFTMSESEASLITIDGKAKIDGEECDFSSSTNEGYTTFSASRTFTEFEDRKNINCDLSSVLIKQSGYSDKSLDTPKDTIILYHYLELKNMKFVSSNADQTIAYDKDVLTVAFETNYSVDIENSVTINDKEISFSENKVSDISYIYTGLLTVEKGDFTTGLLSCSNINIKTKEFNFESTLSFENKISYYADIETGETLFYSNSKYGKDIVYDGETISVSFNQTTEESSLLEIEGKAKVASLEAEFVKSEKDGIATYTATFGPITSDAFNDREELSCDLSGVTIKQKGYEDKKLTDPKNKIVFYKELTVENESFISSNENINKAYNGDTLIVSFNTNIPIKITEDVTINDKTITFKETKDSETQYSYKATHKINAGDFVTGNLNVSKITVKAQDFETQKEISIETSITYEDEISINSTHLTSLNKVGPNIAIDGDTVSVSFEQSKKDGELLTVEGNAVIGTQEAAFSSNIQEEKTVYTASVTITGLEDESVIPCDLSKVVIKQNGYKDKSLNEPEEKIVYYNRISASNIVLYADNDKNYVVNDNILTFSFNTNHKILTNEKLFIGESEVQLSEKKESDGYSYSGKLSILKDTYPDNTVLNIYSNNETDNKTLLIKDEYGNPDVVISLPINTFTYYAPLEPEKTILNFNLETSNQGKTTEGINLVKDKDTIDVSFTTTHGVTVKEAKIGNEKVDVETEDGKTFKTKYTVNGEKLKDQEQIIISIIIDDEKGNDEYTLTENLFKKVLYYSEIKSESDSFESTNTKTNLVKNGESLVLKVKTNHPCDVVSCVIGNTSVTPVTNDNINFTAILPIQNNFEDLEKISARIILSDRAGNPNFNLIYDKQIQYFKPIELTNINARSTNNKDQSKYIKNGENIIIDLHSNHNVTVNASINGSDTQIVKSDNNISVVGGIGNLYDQQNVYFGIYATDEAGNVSEMITQNNIPNTITYYAPITGTGSINASYSKTEGYVKNGDTIYLNIRTNHNTNGTGAYIQTREIGMSGNDTAYTIPYGEGSLPEGLISWGISVEDAAGNTFDTSGTSNIIYDRTSPNVKLNASASGFTNQDVNLFAEYSDTNMDFSSLSFLINDAEYIAGGTQSGNSYTKSNSISNEGTYNIKASATDKAGNTATETSGTIIIDKTNPEVIAINIDFDKSPAYKSGFVLGDWFIVKDDYLKSVICTLTSRTGIGFTKSWDISKGITDEGLLNSSITGEDMAQNISETVNYNFYIDGTVPKPIVKNKSDNTELSTKKTANIAQNSTILISLDKIWMGNEKEDHFTKLEIKDSKGKTVKNLLSQGDISSTEYKASNSGDYTIVLKAIDDVGNETEELIYKFSVSENEVKQNNTEETNKIGLWIAVIAGIFAIIIIVLIIVLQKKKKQDNNNNSINNSSQQPTS